MRTILVVLFMGLFFIQLGQAQEKAQEEQRQPTQQQQPTQHLYPPIRVEIVEDQADAHARQRREAESHQNNKDDLIAQQGMNAATKRMVVIAAEQSDLMQRQTNYICIQTWLMGVGTVLLIGTLILTVTTNKAAVTAANEAITANDIQNRMFEADTRPLIGFPNPKKISLRRKGNGLIVTFRIRNYGKTFASNVRVYMDALSPTVLVASTVTSKEFARRKIGSIGTEPQMILPQQDRDFCIVSRIPKREGMTAGWIIRLCVTYQREGGTKTYYTAAQIVVKPEDAIAAYDAKGVVENIPCRYARESEVAV